MLTFFNVLSVPWWKCLLISGIYFIEIGFFPTATAISLTWWAHHVREMAVAVGKKPISMKYMPDMSKHFHHGTDKTLKKVNKEIKY